MTLQVVWFKRDLRVSDHAALTAAAMHGPVLPLVIVEPAYWRLPDTSARQWNFWRGCINDLDNHIKAHGGALCVRVGSVIDVLAQLHVQYGAFQLWSHQETGNAWTYARDVEVKRWCRAHDVVWHEPRQFGVWRGPHQDRDDWASRSERMMREPQLPAPSPTWAPPHENQRLPTAHDLRLVDDGLVHVQTPGRAAGLSLLHGFLHARGERYTSEMSSPVTGETACSRLSTYLAYGSLSVREVFQAALQRAQELKRPEHALWQRSLRSFVSRLHWHCHFIQKLETEPAVEALPFARVYVGIRPSVGNAEHLRAWSEGKTGYPFVDAAMRYLNAHGWINFRMRAMLMSFATYDLWLSWQQAGMELARKFVDYEPGIHWPQCQMQAGETGINTIRVYSPLKQGIDQDPNGDFVRRWVPELAQVSGSEVHQLALPHASRLLCPQYPLPIVDHATASKFAKDQLFAIRKRVEAQAEANGVYLKHGSRAGPIARRGAAMRKQASKQANTKQKVAASKQLSFDV
jgi:deoxyribodipyrimidine photo-lyase